MIRVLAISDIHGEVKPVQRLRARLTNTFDAIVVAGDIGHDLASTIAVFQILDSFACPVLYIYGNWDHTLAADQKFGANAHHLHDACYTIGDTVFAGISDRSQTWGTHPDIARNLDTALSRQQVEIETIDARIAVGEKHALTDLTGSERRAQHGRLGALHGQRARMVERHLNELERAHNALGDIERRELLQRMTGYPPSKTIVTTHDRLTKTGADMPEVPLFLFGHRHGFKDTRIGRSRFVNVSALDHIVPVLPEHATKRIWDEMRGADLGAFTVIEIGSEIVATSYPLRTMPPGWRQVAGSGRGIGFKPLDQDDCGPL